MGESIDRVLLELIDVDSWALTLQCLQGRFQQFYLAIACHGFWCFRFIRSLRQRLGNMDTTRCKVHVIPVQCDQFRRSQPCPERELHQISVLAIQRTKDHLLFFCSERVNFVFGFLFHIPAIDCPAVQNVVVNVSVVYSVFQCAPQGANEIV